MADGDGGGFFGGIADALGDELKKFGQSATSQVTGNDPNDQQALPTDDSNELKKIGSSILGQVTGSKPNPQQDIQTADLSPASEAKKIGWDIVEQVTGYHHADDLAKAQADDKKFSEQELKQVRAKIAAIYREFDKKKEMEKKQEEQQKVQQEEQKKELEKKQKKEDMDVSIAQQKASAENKNLGAE